MGRGGQAGRHRDHPGHLHLLHRWLSIHCLSLSTVLIFALHSSEQDLGLHGAQSPVHRGTPVQPSVPHTHGRVGACTMDQHRGFCTFQFLHCFASILCAELHNCTLFASQYSVHPALSYIFVGPRWCSRPYGRGWTGSCQPLKGGARLCPQQDAGGESFRQRLTFLDIIFFK